MNSTATMTSMSSRHAAHTFKARWWSSRTSSSRAWWLADLIVQNHWRSDASSAYSEGCSNFEFWNILINPLFKSNVMDLGTIYGHTHSTLNCRTLFYHRHLLTSASLPLRLSLLRRWDCSVGCPHMDLQELLVGKLTCTAMTALSSPS